MHRTNHDESRERGSATLEAAILVPAALLLIGLAIMGGRVAVAHQEVEQAAAASARAASIARTSGQAVGDGRMAGQTALDNRGVRCATSNITIDTSGFGAPVGQPAAVLVQVDCDVALSDLTLPGIPGSLHIHATGNSPIDSYRERGR